MDDSPGLTPLELRAKARRLKLQHDIKCIMIDYMQLMDNPGPESRQQQISEISRGDQGGGARAERAGDLRCRSSTARAKAATGTGRG